jgi:sulfonate dioxygenase
MAVTVNTKLLPITNGKSHALSSDNEGVVSYDINLPYAPQSEAEQQQARLRTEYPEYLPNFDKIWFDPLPEFEYHDPALRADKSKSNLLQPGVSIRHITPKMGTILSGVKLKDLSDAAKDELALLMAERKIVVLRDQTEFLKAGPKFQQDFMAYYGKPNYQPVTGCVKGFPGFHIIHRDNNEAEIEKFFQHKMTSTLWHQDVSYEQQPPGYIMLGILSCPEVGGDTVFADTAEAYR